MGLAASVSSPRDKAHAGRRQLLDARHAVDETPAEAVELPHDHRIELMQPRVGHERVQARPLGLGTTHLVLVDAGQFPTASFDVSGKLLDLYLVVLIARTYSCVDCRLHVFDVTAVT